MGTCVDQILELCECFAQNICLCEKLLNSGDVPKESDCEQFDNNHFDGLPNEMLSTIFSNLQHIDLMNVVKVSKRFRNVAEHARLWEYTSFTGEIFKPEKFQEIMELPIKTLLLLECHIRNKTSSLGKCNFRMYPENLSLIGNATSSYRYILEKCRPKHLIIQKTKIDMNLLEIITSNERLEVLWMHKVSYFGCSGLGLNGNVFRLCVNLKEVDLRHGHLTMKQLNWLCRHIPKTVEILLLNDLHLRGRQYELHFIEIIASRLRNLKVLGVAMLFFERQHNIDCLASLQSLDTLRFCDCNWNQESFSLLFKILPELPCVKTVQFMMKKSKMAGESTQLDRFRKDLEDRQINVEVQFNN